MRSSHSPAAHPVVICGAGAAGIAAAISAARSRANVVLLEARPEIGGTVTHALIHTLGGLYGSNGQSLNAGLPAELEQRLKRADAQATRRRMGRVWVLSVRPWIYARVVQDWIGEHENIRVLSGTRLTGISIDDRCVAALVVHGPRGTEQIQPESVVDATGSAEVARLIDRSLVEDDPERSAGGWIFTLRGVSPGALEIPKGLACIRALRAAAQAGRLPPECENAWLDTGVSSDEAYVKLFMPLRNDWCQHQAALVRDARSTQAAVLEVLARLPEFAHARVDRTGELGVRDGGRIRGEYRLTVDDVLAGRTFPDAVCRCAWPIEYWHPERGVSLTYLDEGDCYEIPLRALALEGYENVWAAGKCLSADRYAHASARVVGTCWAMGEAVGRAAASRGARDYAQCR